MTEWNRVWPPVILGKLDNIMMPLQVSNWQQKLQIKRTNFAFSPQSQNLHLTLKCLHISQAQLRLGSGINVFPPPSLSPSPSLFFLPSFPSFFKRGSSRGKQEEDKRDGQVILCSFYMLLQSKICFQNTLVKHAKNSNFSLISLKNGRRM